MAHTIKTERGFAEVNGARLNYEIAGEGHPLVLVHGGLGDMRMWDDQIEDFASRYRVIRFDMRGFGESQMPTGEFSFHEDILGLLDALGIESAYVLGLSLGGRFVIEFAIAHPDRIDALVLAAPGLAGYEFSDETRQRIDEADALLEAGDFQAGVELELRLWIDGTGRSADEVDPGVRERVREMNTHNYEIYSEEGTPSEPDTPAISRLGEIRAPTLVVVGDRDVPDMQAIAALLVESIPGARRVVMRDVAHHPHMERPEEFNRIVLDFLDTIPA